MKRRRRPERSGSKIFKVTQMRKLYLNVSWKAWALNHQGVLMYHIYIKAIGTVADFLLLFVILSLLRLHNNFFYFKLLKYILNRCGKISSLVVL